MAVQGGTEARLDAPVWSTRGVSPRTVSCPMLDVLSPQWTRREEHLREAGPQVVLARRLCRAPHNIWLGTLSQTDKVATTTELVECRGLQPSCD